MVDASKTVVAKRLCCSELRILHSFIFNGLQPPKMAARPCAAGNATRSAFPWESTDLLAVLAKNQTEPKNAVSRFLHFQRLAAAENGGTSLCRGKRD
jgi:hypothetical protein